MPHREPATLRPATLPVILATTLLVTVNAAIVNVALTSIRHDLGFTANTISWVINAYLLAYGGLLIVGGRLGDVIGRRRAMLIGLALFTAAALVGGFAGSPAVLVAARGVQGVGGALAAPAVLAMITDLYQDSARAKALSWFSVVLGVGLSFGFIAGGVILQWLDWRWVFWINVPVGIALFPLTLLFVPALRASQKHRLDVAGAVLATLTAVGVVLAVVQLANLHRPDAVFALSVAVAAVALIGLVLRLRTASEPLIPLGMFLRRSTVGALVAMTLQSGAATALLFFLSQLFAGGLGLVPIGVGALFLVFTAPQLATALSANRFMRTFRVQQVLAAGLLVGGLGFVLLSVAVRTHAITGFLIAGMILAGAGPGVVYLGVNITVLASVEPELSGSASGVIQTSVQLGSSIGIAILVLVQSLTDVTGALLGAAIFCALAIAATFLHDRPAPCVMTQLHDRGVTTCAASGVCGPDASARRSGTSVPTRESGSYETPVLTK